MQEQSVRAALAGLPIPEIRYYETTGSTNDVALAWVEAGAPDQSLVIADAQTRGRGRMDRRWVTQPASALAFSLVLRPTKTEMRTLRLFSPLGGLAVSRALEQKFGLKPEIKWPNDVLLDRRKVCGILVEASWIGSEMQGLVAGIGVNVAPGSVPPANEVLFPAGCVEEAAGRAIEREELLKEILQALVYWRHKLGSKAFMDAWEERLAFRNEWVLIEQPGQKVISGQVMGVEADGNLRLRTPDGGETSIAIGDVHLRPQEKHD
jgi:BirA family biotin operon repressor/biotin-[acetyl-CoA-carboxylase] ligase